MVGFSRVRGVAGVPCAARVGGRGAGVVVSVGGTGRLRPPPGRLGEIYAAAVAIVGGEKAAKGAAADTEGGRGRGSGISEFPYGKSGENGARVGVGE